MVKVSRLARFTLLAVLGLALGMAVLAAAPPFPITWQGVKAPLPQSAGWSGVATVNGKIYVFGGLTGTETENSLTLNTTQIYDPTSDTWTAGAAMPTARYLCTAAVVGGKIYVMGGRTIDSSGAGGPVDVNEVYDPATNTWTTAKNTPSPIRGQMPAVWNNKIYLFGGNTGTYQKTVNIYDPASNAWSTGASMPVVRAYGAAVAVPSKNRIYVIGGDNGGTTASKYIGNAISYDPAGNTWDSATIPMVSGEFTSNFGAALGDDGKVYVFPGSKWNTSVSPPADNGYSGVIQILDPAAGTMTAFTGHSPSPLVRNEAGAINVGGKIYVIGGASGFRVVDVFDPATGAFFEPNKPVPNYVGSAAAQAVNGKIYVIGGGNGGGMNSAVYVYDTASGTWTTASAANPKPLFSPVADVWNGKIAMADGSTSSGVDGSAQIYDPAAGTFTAMATDPNATNVACGAVVGNALYVFGGYNGTADVAVVRALDLSANTWSTKANLPNPMEAGTAVAYNGKIYIFGGYVGSATASNLNENVIIYDPAGNTFTAGAAFPIPIYEAAATVYNNHIIISGGRNLYNQGVTNYYRLAPFIQVYDPAADAFTSAQGLYSRANHKICVLNGLLYQVGGDDGNSYGFLEDRLDIANLGGGPSPLAAHASADKTGGATPLAVQFTGSASGGTGPYTYSWNFGDGSAASTDQNPSHTYTVAGTFNAVLTVKDSTNATATDQVTITPGAAALTATASANKTSGSKPLAVAFTGSASGGTAPYTYSWNFGDDSTASTDQNPTHTYADAGTYHVTLTVTDSTSATATDTHLAITVTAAAPPVVTLMKKAAPPAAFTLIVTGSNLQANMKVYINETQWTNVQYKTTAKIKIAGGKSLKALVPKGQTTHFRFENPDGGETTYDFHY